MTEDFNLKPNEVWSVFGAGFDAGVCHSYGIFPILASGCTTTFTNYDFGVPNVRTLYKIMEKI